MRSQRILTSALAFVFAVVVVESIQARPKYKGRYEKVFKDEIAESKTTKVDCAMCHPGSDKKDRNDYGKKLADELGEQNVTDEDKIDKALKKIGAHPNHKKSKPEPKPELSLDPGPDPTPQGRQ